jgi:hypothetical protein
MSGRAQVALPAVALAVVEALAEAVVSPGSSRAAAHLRSVRRLQMKDRADAPVPLEKDWPRS